MDLVAYQFSIIILEVWDVKTAEKQPTIWKMRNSDKNAAINAKKQKLNPVKVLKIRKLSPGKEREKISNRSIFARDLSALKNGRGRQKRANCWERTETSI